MALPLEATVPAKINLWLEITGKRSDGYHEISSLMLPIEIYDYLKLIPRQTGIIIRCSHPQVPLDSTNLAYRAADLYLQRSASTIGVEIILEKEIPVGAGLGGGSADAAGVLLGMNRLHEGRLSPLDLHNLARQLGADVPFFLAQRAALATGIGERLEYVHGVPAYPLLLIKPPLTVSTHWVYSRLKLTRNETRIKIAPFLAHPWRLHDAMENDLETVTIEAFPILSEIKKWMVEHGALGSLMSGSGPTIFGIYREAGLAEEAGKLARQIWQDCWVKVTRARSISSAN